METLSELMVFKGDEDARKFFYLYEDVATKGIPDTAKAEKIVAYLGGEVFDFYFERFTIENGPILEAKNYQLVKKEMLKKFSTQKSEAEVMLDTISLTYDGGDIPTFLVKAEKAYNRAKFNEQAKYGLLIEALKSDQLLLQFVLLRGAKSYDEVKKYCTDYAENQKMMKNPAGKQMNQVPTRKNNARFSNDTHIDELCREVEKLHLFMSRVPRNQRQQKPLCHEWIKKGHYASQ